jgi:hypothetical protein
MGTSNRTREVVERAREVGASTATVVGEIGAKTASVVGEVGGKTVTAVGSGVKKSLATAKAGLDRAGEKLDAEEQRWDARKERTDMPGIRRDDPLGDLAERLDRQADFFRELAVDAMRPGMVRGALVALVLVATVVAGLAGLAVVGRVFLGGGELSGLAPVGALLGGAGLAATLVGFVVERGRANVAREALSRAEQAEARLSRVAELMTLERHDPDALVRTLSREPAREASEHELR